jgi:hypothetical protein
VLKQYNRKRPGRGLPKKEEDRYAGIHSGTVSLLRIAGPGDRFYKPHDPRTFVVQYVATYKFNDLRRTPLKKGEITAQGLNQVEGADTWGDNAGGTASQPDIIRIDPPRGIALTRTKYVQR